MTDLIHRLDTFISSKKLIKTNDNLLVTVSGGMDSMFLLTYLFNKNYKLAVAHCNFGLRGNESDGDEAFVKSFCKTNQIKFHTKRFETETYSKANGISIQMAARDLRYQWFNELCEADLAFGETKIVTAHHKTDNAETILLNMVRGTGLKGLEGISPISENKIRPLLCLTRDEIETLVKELKITYREDSSNKSDKYHRNRLRLNVLPELKKINPEFENTFQANAEIVRQANGFINHFIETIKNEISTGGKKSVTIDINKMQKCPEPRFVLFSILSEFGFNAPTVDDIFESLSALSGKLFFSSTHRLVIDRTLLIIEPLHHSPFQSYGVTPETKSIETPYHYWKFELLTSNFKFPISSNEGCFDFEKLNFPLTVRPWQQGDKIKPLGMHGHKKVSDILVDKKVSIPDKEKVWVVISENEIIWVGGLVVSEDYKITSDTKRVLQIVLELI